MKNSMKYYTPTWKRRIASGLLAFAMSLPLIPNQSKALLEEELLETSEVQLEVLAESATEPTIDSTTESTEAPLTAGDDSSDSLYSDELIVPEEQGHWADPYIEKMVSYGYMREQDAIDPDAPMSRAEFASVVNRAYNYTDTGAGMEYTDVTPQDWFYDDIAIATTAGYISGTSPTTVEPHSTLTRETTAFILGKNMMLPDLYGENTVFTDTREISDWSRSMVKATSAYGLMAGYNDGTFRPTNNITNGEIATLVSKAIGTPIQNSGEISLGEILGNVTITESGTVLKNTVIAGDLFISNGIGLGSVVLENVTVLGRIVVSGGESQDGDASILLRNVVANELVIDNMDDQKVSVRADGNTLIEKTDVRTNAYVEDTTTTDMGLREINIDADAGTVIDLAGRIKTVNNTSSGTNVRVTTGTVDVMNIDETATEVITEIMMGAEVFQLNIDVATDVIGDGDIENLTVNAEDVVVEMLPDNVTIRPGISANVNGQDMDHLVADSISAEPRILSGYPIAYDVAPTTMDAIFATNKEGTVYWGISYISQGSISAADLIDPPTYGNTILQFGSITIGSAEDEYVAPITDLYVGGDYYLSAVLVDARGDESPVKIVAFTTPDDSVPAFVEPTPYMSDVGNTSAQVTVMASKDCKLYYAVMSSGAVAPTPTDFIANSLSGNWGTGNHSLEKNKSYAFTVSLSLNELTEYDLFLWLTDADNMHYSEVVQLTFTTSDGTPPVFNQDMQTTQIGVSDVTFNFNLNEDGMVYWAVVEYGTNYPVPQPPNLEGLLAEPLNSDYAPYAIMWGVASTFNGEQAAVANGTVEFNISGLEEETAYTMYYVGRDVAENFTESVYTLDFNTIDHTPPTFIEQKFSHTANSETDTESAPEPYSTTDITLVFSEGIQSRTAGSSFLSLYNNILNAADGESTVAAKNALAKAMEECFTFYIYTSAYPDEAPVRNADNEATIGDNWVIDYRNVEITVVDKQMYVTFPTIIASDGSRATSALNLATGITYGFKLSNIRDSSSDANTMQPAELTLDTFTTVYAEIMLGTADVMVGNLPYKRDELGIPHDVDTANVDADLMMRPSDMSTVDPSIVYEMRLNPEEEIAFNLYMRVVDSNGNAINAYEADSAAYTALKAQYPTTPNLRYTTEYKTDPTGAAFTARLDKVTKNYTPDENGWILFNRDDVADTASTSGNPATIQGNGGGNGVGLFGYFMGYQGNTMAYPFLNTLGEDYAYQFVFEVLYYNGTTDAGQWNGMTTVDVHVYAGNYSNISSIGAHGSPLQATLNLLSKISSPTDYESTIIFNETSFPTFGAGAPMVYANDIDATLNVSLNRQGTVYYAIAQSDNPNNLSPTHMKENASGVLEATDVMPVDVPDIVFETYESYIAAGGSPSKWPTQNVPYPTLISPIYGTVVNNQDQNVISGSVAAGTGGISIPVEGLSPLTTYYVYLVTESVNGSGYSQVYMGKFMTKETFKPKYTTLLPDIDTGNVDVAVHVDSLMTYVMMTTSSFTNNNVKYLLEPFYSLLDLDAKSAVPTTESTATNPVYYTYGELYRMTNFWKNVDSKYLNEDGSNIVSGDQGSAYTVMDMLKAVYASNSGITHPDYSYGYTVFDVLADDDLKQKVYTTISTFRVQTVAEGNNVPMTAEEVENIKRSTQTGDDPDMEYFFFVASRNVNSDGTLSESYTHTFAAIDNIFVRDLVGPILTSSTTLSASYTKPLTGLETYTGTFTFDFNKYLYAADGSTPYFLQVLPSNVVGGVDTNAPSDDAWEGEIKLFEDLFKPTFTDIGGESRTITVQTDSIDKEVPQKGFTFAFENMSDGDSFTIFTQSQYFLSNKNAVKHSGDSAQMILTFRVGDPKVFSEVVYGKTDDDEWGGIRYTVDVAVWWESNWDTIDGVVPAVSTVRYSYDVPYATDPNPPETDTGTGTGDVVTPDVTIPVPTSIQLTQTSIAKLLLGAEDSISATVVGGTGDEKVSWSVSNSTALTLDSSGNKTTFIAKYPGTYTITASYDTLKETCTVTVPSPTVTVTGTSSTAASTKAELTVTVSDVYDLSKLSAANQVATWKSPNSNVKFYTLTNAYNSSSSSTLKQSAVGGDCVGTIYYDSTNVSTPKITATCLGGTGTIDVEITGNASGAT